MCLFRLSASSVCGQRCRGTVVDIGHAPTESHVVAAIRGWQASTKYVAP